MEELKKIVAALRGPEGCPWDKKQTHQSLIPFLLEEAWEVIEEIEEGRHEQDLEAELGDLLFQVVLHAQIAEEEGRFDLESLIARLGKKMRERHPHVFAQADPNQTETELKAQWDQIKARTQQRESVLEGIPQHQPQALQAKKLGERAAGLGFEFPTNNEILAKIKEELQEVEAELAQENQQNLVGEIGDLLFSVINLARFNRINPEMALKQSNDKFKQRFAQVEKGIKKAEKSGKKLSLKAMEDLWQGAKESL